MSASPRVQLLEAAAKIVDGGRSEYGTVENNFGTIARLWTDWLQARGFSIVDLQPSDIAALMALMKLARLATTIDHADSWTDLAGYAACGFEVTHPARTATRRSPSPSADEIALLEQAIANCDELLDPYTYELDPLSAAAVNRKALLALRARLSAELQGLQAVDA